MDLRGRPSDRRSRGLRQKLPLVSVVLTTRDRPRFLQMALACYNQQSYPNRELIVVDDGDAWPAAEDLVRDARGRLLRVPPGAPLGAKLNRGVEAARGILCQKFDDDDWYGPDFLASMVSAWMDGRRTVCMPSIAFLTPFLFFDVARWEVRLTRPDSAPGATLLFAREDWEERPFRAVRFDEDTWFFRDQLALGRGSVVSAGLESFLAIRHRGVQGDRSHTWVSELDGQPLERHVEKQELYRRQPEQLLPPWALDFYAALRDEILASREFETTPG